MVTVKLAGMSGNHAQAPGSPGSFNRRQAYGTCREGLILPAPRAKSALPRVVPTHLHLGRGSFSHLQVRVRPLSQPPVVALKWPRTSGRRAASVAE